MLRYLSTLILFISGLQFSAQDIPITVEVKGGQLEGSLLIPETNVPVPIVLIIAGSGPTDRNGNQGDLENNSLMYLAQEFQKNGIATLRYDKRGIGQSSDVEKDELTMRLETFADDAKAWITKLHSDKRFSKLIVAGHSEGSLLGMLASKKNKDVNAFISIAGPGRPLDVILKEQLANVQDDVKATMFGYIDKLKKGDTLGDVPPIYYMLFRPSIQPFLISMFKYDPAKELKKLQVPILILQGTTDIQVKEKDAFALSKAEPKAKIKLIKDMNHVLKNCSSTDKTIQTKTYEDPSIPIVPEVVTEVTTFVLSLK